MTTYEIVNNYITEMEVSLSQNTIKSYVSILTDFARICKNEKADRTKVIEYIKKLQNDGNSNNSIRTKIVVLKSFVKWASNNGFYDNDFAATIKMPSAEYHVAERMSLEEVSAMLHEAPPKGTHSASFRRNKAIMELAIVTASRVSAICSLKREDIDLENKTVRFKHTKRNKELIMPLTEALCKSLSEYINIERPKSLSATDYLFVGEKPDHNGEYKPLSRQAIFNISKRYTEAACGKALSPHKLRHTSASTQLESGLLSMDEISKNLGHSSISTTQRYAQRLNDNGRKAATVAVFEGL